MRRRRAFTIIGINALLVAVGASTPTTPVPPGRPPASGATAAEWPVAGVPAAPREVDRAAGVAIAPSPTATLPAATALARSRRDEVAQDRRDRRNRPTQAPLAEPATVAVTGTIALSETIATVVTGTTALSETLVTVVTSTTALSETTAPEVAITSPEGDEVRLTPAQLAEAQAAVQSAQAQMARARRGVTAAAIARAEAEVRKAETNLKRVPLGGMTSAEVAAGEERVRQADANLRGLASAKTPPEAIAAAEAAVRQYEAATAALLATPATPEDIAAAAAALGQAEGHLQSLAAPPAPEQVAAAEQRVTAAQQQYEAIAYAASANKTAAEQAVALVTAELNQAQEAYSTALWQHEQAQAGADPLTGAQFNAEGGGLDALKQPYIDALAVADYRLREVEARLQEANATLQVAQQREVEDTAVARIELDAALAERDALLAVADPSAYAQAEAAVVAWRDRLAYLRQTHAATLESQGKLDQARAALLKLQGGPTQPDLAAAQAELDAARAALEQARAAAAQEAARQAQAQAQAQAELDKAAAELSRAKQAGGSRDGWFWPTFGHISSAYGLRDFHVARWHNGVDIANKKDTPIAAARDGVVTEAGWCSGYGFCVKIKHAGGFSTEYGHLAGPPPVRAGDAVAAGTIVGAMGTTYDREGGGFSTGVHLHFTIRRNGQAVDPLQYLP